MHTVYRPSASALETAGYAPLSSPPNGNIYDIVLCNLPKQKEEARYMLAQALQAAKDGALILAGAANDAGGKRIEEWMKYMNITTQSLSADKARVVWGQKTTENETSGQWLTEGEQQSIVLNGTAFLSQPGLFSWNRIDPGSALLARYLPADLNGIGADFGCGYGYLSRAILDTAPAVKTLHCIDADRRAVNCCLKNLGDMEHTAHISGHWMDLSVEKMQDLDWIIMNPPFHTGKTTRTDLGQAMIRTAATSLKPGGTLYMVANKSLPYESILQERFSNVTKLAEDEGYKIYHARL